MVTPDNLVKFGQLIRSARKTKDYTQDEVSKLAKVAKGYLSDLERGYVSSKGIVVPSDEVIGSLAAVLDIRPSDLHKALGRIDGLEELERISDDEMRHIAGLRNMPEEVRSAIGRMIEPYIPPESDELPIREIG
jgi:transcriptional regulator with XRE-family HTH domain